MFQRFALVAALLFPVLGASAQETDNQNSATKVEKPSRDFVMLQFTYEGWANKLDSIKTTGFGRGFNGYLCYDFPIKNSNFSFATGIGVGISNIFFDNQQLIQTDSGQTAARFIPERHDYNKFKLVTTYLEAPFELRFFSNKENRNKGFKMAVGLRAGTLVAAHTKGNRTENGSKLSEKVSSRDFMERWRFGGTARIGYGNFSLFGAYNFNSVFKDNLGPAVTPYSIGLCITGL
jgi:hypothetical protein